MEIKKKWETKEEVSTRKAQKQGCARMQVEALRESLRMGMEKEMMMLDQDWEEMWSA